MTADAKLLSDGLSDVNACMQIEVLLPGFEGFNGCDSAAADVS